MGYTTDFTGHFDVTPALTESQIARLNKFAEDRHENYAAEGKPDYYCQWIPNEDGTRIEWDGNEKFYGYIDWIKYMIGFFFEPWGVKLNGVVEWEGEERGDHGTITIKNNVLTVKEAKKRAKTITVPKAHTTPPVLTKSLETATEAELRAALKKLEEQKNAPPARLSVPDLTQVIDAAIEHAETIAKTGRTPKDSEHFIFEAVMMAVYGPGYFTWESRVLLGLPGNV